MRYRFVNRFKNRAIHLFAVCSFSNCSAQSPGYNSLKKEILHTRDSLYAVYTGDTSKRDSVVRFAQSYLLTKIASDLVQHWYGTPWEFYGMTTEPRKGTIACGYFVCTVLEHAGFNIPRVQWAQMASEPVIKKLTKDLKHIIGKPVADVETYIEERPDGLYIVGLDYHVGFICKLNGEIKFIHSNYYEPAIGVMSQDLNTRNPLTDSRYRVIGRILTKENVVDWMKEKRIE